MIQRSLRAILLLWPCLFLLWPNVLRAGRDRELAARVQPIIDRRVETRANLSLVVGLVSEKGSRLFTAGPAKPGGRTVFEIGSITKVFTGILLAEAVRRGEVKLNDPIVKHLPPRVKLASKRARDITLLDLATHTSGLPRMPSNWRPRDPKDPYSDYSVQDLYRYLASDKNIGRDRNRYQYSNLGYGLLGHLLAGRAGMDYGTLILERISLPLGLADTRINLSSGQRSRLAVGHNAAGQAAPYWSFGVLASCGALHSTAEDLLKFAAANTGRSETSLSPVLRDVQLPRRKGPAPNVKIGLGWHMLNLFGQEIFFHDGGTGGFGGFVCFTVKDRIGVVVLSDTTIVAESISDIGLHLLQEKFPLRPERRAVDLDPLILETYMGRYTIRAEDGKPAATITISRRDKGLLYKEENDEEATPILPTSETEFFFKAFANATIKFVRDERGRVSGLIIFSAGQKIQARKID